MGASPEYFPQGNLPNDTAGKAADFSFAAWVKTPWNGSDGQSHTLLDTGACTVVKAADGTLRFTAAGAADLSANVTARWAEDIPHHVAVTFHANGSQCDRTVYLDGVARAQTVGITWTPAAHTKMNLANPSGGFVIAEPSVFDYTLTQDEVMALFQSTRSTADLATGRRIEEVNRTHKALLFNAPLVYDTTARVAAPAVGSTGATWNPAATTTGDTLAINGRMIDGVLKQTYAAYPTGVQFPEKGNIAEGECMGTLECWVQTPWAGGAEFATIFSSVESSGQNGIVLELTDTGLSFRLQQGTSSLDLIPSINATNWPANTPHHLVGTWRMTTPTTVAMALYLDGKKLAANEGTFGQGTTGHSGFVLGNALLGQSVNDLNGNLYDLAIYAHAFNDGGVTVGDQVATGSEAYQAWKSIAHRGTHNASAFTAAPTTPFTESGAEDLSAQADGARTAFALGRGLLLDPYDGTAATTDDVTVSVDGARATVTAMTPGGYARLAAAVTSESTVLAIDSAVAANAAIGGYALIGNPSGTRKREWIAYTGIGGGATPALQGVQRGLNGTPAAAWPSGTVVEICATVTLAAPPPATGAKVFAAYAYSGDVLDRWRGLLPENMNRAMFLDVTGNASTGWALASSNNYSGTAAMQATDTRGQNVFWTVSGTWIDAVATRSPSQGMCLFVADEGTAWERRVVLDLYDPTTWQAKVPVFTDLLPGLHTLRMVQGVDKNAASPGYAAQVDALESR